MSKKHREVSGHSIENNMSLDWNRSLLDNRCSILQCKQQSLAKQSIADGFLLRAAEQGTHEELLEAGGFYANLYNSQFEKAEAV